MNLDPRVRKTLDALPDEPGVYLMRDRSGRVIYVGKAVSLRKRVQSYFRASTQRRADPKLRSLVKSVADLEFVALRNEAEATLFEGKLIKEYRPRYNVSFKDDKRFLMLRAHPGDPFPRFTAVRLQRDDGARYFGPYASSQSARAALEFVEKRFGLRRCRPRLPGPEDHRHCLNDIIRYCCAPCIGKASEQDYAARFGEACAFLRGERPAIVREIRDSMAEAAAAQNYERAAALRDTMRLLDEAVRRRVLAGRPAPVREADARNAVGDLQRLLGLPAPPRTIECYDISNISGTLAVGSMVCAEDGLPRRSRYRLFRIRTVEGSDDPAMMAEVIRRRFARAGQAGWAPPDMVLVDGGITQLRAARAELDRLGFASVATAGLAKQLEQIHHGPPDAERVLTLPRDTPALLVLRALRDEAHRFALTYHCRLRAERMRESVLDEIEGVGESRKKGLLLRFGSVRRLMAASEAEIAAVEGIGPVLAGAIRAALHRGDEADADRAGADAVGGGEQG